MRAIFHVTSATAAAAAAQRAPSTFRGGSRSMGSCHRSYAQQVTKIANINFYGQRGLVLLEIDPRASLVRWLTRTWKGDLNSSRTSTVDCRWKLS
jgi:uncharacterized protein (DUF952 family)